MEPVMRIRTRTPACRGTLEPAIELVVRNRDRPLVRSDMLAPQFMSGVQGVPSLVVPNNRESIIR